MRLRLILSAIIAFIGLSLFAQPEIVSITYDGDVATLTSNVPPAGIVYYWQGTSCGTLMNHSSSTTVATTNGTYFLREYNSAGAVWATACASTTVTFPDLTPPILSGVTAGPIEEGDPIAATSNENGMIFLVPAGTPANYGSIVASRVASASATANVAVELLTAGNGLGDFVVYATDAANNVSAASAVITVTDLTAPVLSNVTTGPIDEGDPIAATSNENGMIYLVLEGTAANLTAINTDKVAEAVATANTPVSLSTTGIGLGLFKVFAVDAFDNISVASDFIEVTDLTPPVLSDVTAGPVDVGDDIAATSNENGIIYLVPEGTAGNLGAVNAAKVSEVAASANTPASLSTTGIPLGNYIVYAMDGFDNFSTASPVIEVADLTAPVLSDVTAGPVEVGTDILATSNEDGMIYLVPGGTAPDIGDITSAQVSQAISSANVASTLATTGIDAGDYATEAAVDQPIRNQRRLR